MILTVQQRLDNTCSRFPDKVAFGDENRELTFSGLRTEAAKLGCAIAKKGIKKAPICIYMEKKIECISAMIGIGYSGNFYTVIDTSMPEARVKKILDVLQPAMMVAEKGLKEQAESVCGLCEGMQPLYFEDAMETEVDEELLQKIQDECKETDTMYVLFTSGSTGQPKGVVISHKAVSRYLDCVRETFDFNENTVFANQCPFYFIFSGFEIFSTVNAGCTCYIVPVRYFSFPVMVLNYLKEKHVNTLDWVPSVFCYIANINALPEVHLDELKYVMFGGETMPSKQMNMWRKEYPDATFVNLYGPTELTDLTTYYVVDREIKDDEILPIGKVASHMKVLLLDENNKEVPLGQPGELCGTGPSLADGYYHMPEKTAEVFVPNPLYKEGDDPDTKMMYRTGDLAMMDESGNLLFMGRKDFQIKHMGNRIELGEIEASVSALNGVDMNCCHYDTERQQIVLFYTGRLEPAEVEEALKQHLPYYMIPNRMEKLAEMPFNLNGKIDRAGLKKLI